MYIIFILESLLIPDITMEAYKPDDLDYKEFKRNCVNVYNGLYNSLYYMNLCANEIKLNSQLTNTTIMMIEARANETIKFIEKYQDRYWGITKRIEDDTDPYIFEDIQNRIKKCAKVFIDPSILADDMIKNITEVMYKYKTKYNDFSNAAIKLIPFYNNMKLFTQFYIAKSTFYKLSNPKIFYDLL